MPLISKAQWEQYERDGFLRLGQVASDAQLKALQTRIDDIMLGKAPVNYDKMLMQLDSSTGAYEDAGVQSRGFKGPTLNYRKIQELEYDPIFLAYMQHPLFKEICDYVYSPQTAIACFRAMFMNKPAHKGTLLPWHQDRWVHLDKDPLITVWTALDPATIQNGCVQVIPGSHKSLLNPSHPSGFLSKEQAQSLENHPDAVFLELKAGEVVLLHNWTLHRSDTNRSDISRRAFSVCYMDASTKHKHAEGEVFTRVFGPNSLTPESVALSQPVGV
jgi:hypothetical protein